MTKDITAGITFKTVKKKDNVTIEIAERLLSPKDSCSPNGWPAGKPWTEKEAAEADAAASFGFERSDFTDTSEDLHDLKEIIEGGN